MANYRSKERCDWSDFEDICKLACDWSDEEVH